MKYAEFINSKKYFIPENGFNSDLQRYFFLKDYQSAITKWALKKGRAAIFADTGLGKTLMQLVWAREVSDKTNGTVLILAPIAVGEQTIQEANKFNICLDNIEIINYEQLHNIDPSIYSGVVLDESSILKGMSGKVRKQLTTFFKNTSYKLSCTATPSPNDYMEIGTQSEFLGVMSQIEMLAMFFVHDGSETQKWRLKGHGKNKFFMWMATWCIYIAKPSDIGFNDEGYNLPQLHYHEHIIESGIKDGLFAPIAQGLLERNRARRDTINSRVYEASMIANGIDDHCLIWCHLNDEGDLLKNLIHDSVQVSGSDKKEIKKDILLGFSSGKYRKLITKPKIAGFGMNFQICNNMIFVGLNDSWEQLYQAIRRCWRYGQENEVHVHIISSDIESGVLLNIKRKEKQNAEMKKEIIKIMKNTMLENIETTKTEKADYIPVDKMEIPKWIK